MAPGVVERSPRPYVALNPEDLARAGFVEGDEVLVTIGDESGRFAVRALPSLPPGTAGVPIGLPMTPWLTIPSPARIHKAQAAP